MSPDQYSSVKDARGAIEPLWFAIWDILFPGVLRPYSIWATDVVVQNANNFYDANAHTTVEQYMREHEDEMPAEFHEAWLHPDARQRFLNMVVEAMRPLADRRPTINDSDTTTFTISQDPNPQIFGVNQMADNAFNELMFGPQSFQHATSAEHGLFDWRNNRLIPSSQATIAMNLGLPSGIIPLTPPITGTDAGSPRGPRSENPSQRPDSFHVDDGATMRAYDQIPTPTIQLPFDFTRQIIETGGQFQIGAVPQLNGPIPQYRPLPANASMPHGFSQAQTRVPGENVVLEIVDKEQHYDPYQDEEHANAYGSYYGEF